ncbi:hypothetical protein [Chondromyces crocatus]|uniref:Uncharacterized protein n=1 Tax=Chondromyces crocatus TaxID=52 RepID=A0A0K1EH27_CHOCO|nr:hypothetical protein [Chondromyces crocatus]AKT39992.1 uncharacterized protein CMC5_041450 [Chondromyces crocatus]
MSIESLNVDDPRSFIFTIDGSPEPLYQVESRQWARPEYRWAASEIPAEIRTKVAELESNGKPGAFVRFEDDQDGVYVICEQNIKMVPEVADEDVLIAGSLNASSGRSLSHYDIVVHAKAGPVPSNGETLSTEIGEYYVIRYENWGRYVLHQSMRPQDVVTTKEILLLLERLHGTNFLSMTPDKPEEGLPPNVDGPTDAIVACNCYVLNLARFKR